MASSNCPYDVSSARAVLSLFNDKTKAPSNFTAFVDQCPGVCESIVGDGNPDLSGIGLFISYIIQACLTSIFGWVIFLASPALEERAKTSLKILTGLQRLFVEFNVYVSVGVIISCFIRLLQVPTVYELLLLPNLVRLQVEMLAGNLLFVITRPDELGRWKKLVMFIIYLLILLAFTISIVAVASDWSSSIGSSNPGYQSVILTVYDCARISATDTAISLEIGSNLVDTVSDSKLVASLTLPFFIAFWLLGYRTDLGISFRAKMKSMSIWERHKDRLEEIRNELLQIHMLGGWVVLMVILTTCLYSVGPESLIFAGLGILTLACLYAITRPSSYAARLNTLYTKVGDYYTELGRRHRLFAKVLQNRKYLKQFFWAPFILYYAMFNLAVGIIGINQLRLTLQLTSHAGDAENEWGVGQTAALLAWFPFFMECCRVIHNLRKRWILHRQRQKMSATLGILLPELSQPLPHSLHLSTFQEPSYDSNRSSMDLGGFRSSQTRKLAYSQDDRLKAANLHDATL